MKDGHVMFLRVEQLAGDLVGLSESGRLLLPALLDIGLTGDLLGDVRAGRLADGHNERPGCGFTEYLLLRPLQAGGVAHHAVLAGHGAVGSFWFGTLRV